MRIRIILADDDTVIRQGIRMLLAQQQDLEVVAEASNGRELLELYRGVNPDVILMDVSMPDLNGIEATRQIIEEAPGVKVIALSMHSDLRMATGMLSAGAAGYLLKNCASDELVQAIHRVMEGRTYLSPALTDTLVEDYVSRFNASGPPVSSVLTPREREVLQLITEGMTTKLIASHLHVSVKTIETHRRHIMDKLNIHTVAELTKYAVREGLTSLDA